MHTGRISSKHQLTLPTELVRALHLRTGDTLEFRLTAHHTLELLPLRPNFEVALEQFLQAAQSSGEVKPTEPALEDAHSHPTSDALLQPLTLESTKALLSGVSHD